MLQLNLTGVFTTQPCNVWDYETFKVDNKCNVCEDYYKTWYSAWTGLNAEMVFHFGMPSNEFHVKLLESLSIIFDTRSDCIFNSISCWVRRFSLVSNHIFHGIKCSRCYSKLKTTNQGHLSLSSSLFIANWRLRRCHHSASTATFR